MNLQKISKEVFFNTFNQILNKRYSTTSIIDDFGKNESILREDSFINVGTSNADIIIQINSYIRKNTIQALLKILYLCNEELKCFEPIKKISLKKYDQNNDIVFALKDNKKKILYLFKNIDNGQFFIEEFNNKELANKYEVQTVETIYLIFEKIESLVINYDYLIQKNKPIHVHPLKWFFLQYFKENEWLMFREEYNQYSKKLEEYIGLTITKNFSPFSLMRFKKIIEKNILKYPYYKIKTNYINYNNIDYKLGQEDFDTIFKNYINEKKYLQVISDNAFSQSFITAEWLFDSMNKAKAIDLTVIAMGYFKSIEQLLYCIIKKTKSDYNDEKTLGDMALYIKRNKNKLFFNNITPYAKNYIIQSIFKYKDIRNNFLHKKNISSFNKINEIKDMTYSILFLIIGAMTTNENTITLNNTIDDLDKFGELVDFYQNRLYFICNRKQQYIVRRTDLNSIVLYQERISYKEIVLQDINTEKNLIITRDNYPEQIYLAKLDLNYNGKVNINLNKHILVFDKGKYIGPDIANSIDFKY